MVVEAKPFVDLKDVQRGMYDPYDRFCRLAEHLIEIMREFIRTPRGIGRKLNLHRMTIVRRPNGDVHPEIAVALSPEILDPCVVLGSDDMVIMRFQLVERGLESTLIIWTVRHPHRGTNDVVDIGRKLLRCLADAHSLALVLANERIDTFG
jgi:hypothetical protein